MFNAIGHLSKADFEQAMYTIHTNLNDGGIYLFDICDADMLRAGDAITKLTIDWQEKLVDKTVRKIQYSTIDDDGVLASHTIYHEQALNSEPVITNHIQTLQIYSAKELEEMLERNGFETVSCELVKYHEDETERLFVIGRKK
jgi:hypothetical protein